MKAKISIITLGVDDLDRATRFYRDGLGLPCSSHSSDKISFFELSGTWLALYPWRLLAEDACVDREEAGARPHFGGMTLAHNVDSKAEVDAVLAQAVQAGAALAKPAADVFWGGYSGYFRDPDGHLWEVAWNPFFTP